jgi:hypothetical protein
MRRSAKKETIVIVNRKGFLASSASVAAASTVVAGEPVAQAQAGIPGGTHRVERRASFDERAFAAAVGRPAQIRQLYEATAFNPAVLSSIKNSFNGLQFGFGFPANAIAIALAGHGASAVYGYSDYVWKKYRVGEFFKLKDSTGAAISTNVFLAARADFDARANPDDDGGMYQDTGIETLQRRGLVVLTCHTAVEEQARALVRGGFAQSGMSDQDVADDILTHLIAGAIVVPSMVATIAVLQTTYHYSYLTPA